MSNKIDYEKLDKIRELIYHIYDVFEEDIVREVKAIDIDEWLQNVTLSEIVELIDYEI
jgi:hypothetical protein